MDIHRIKFHKSVIMIMHSIIRRSHPSIVSQHQTHTKYLSNLIIKIMSVHKWWMFNLASFSQKNYICTPRCVFKYFQGKCVAQTFRLQKKTREDSTRKKPILLCLSRLHRLFNEQQSNKKEDPLFPFSLHPRFPILLPITYLEPFSSLFFSIYRREKVRIPTLRRSSSE